MAELGLNGNEGTLAPYPVAAAAVIEIGNLVGVNAAGFAVEATSAVNCRCVGIATETIDNTAGLDGALAVEVESGRTFRLIGQGFADVDICTLAYAGNTAELVLPASFGAFPVPVGVVQRVVAGNVVEVAIPRGGMSAEGAFSSVPGNLTVPGTSLFVGAVQANAAVAVGGAMTAPSYTAPGGSPFFALAPAGQSAGIRLGDAAGATFFRVEDSAGVPVVFADSDGELTAVDVIATGTATIPLRPTAMAGIAPTQVELLAALGAAADGRIALVQEPVGTIWLEVGETGVGWHQIQLTVAP